MYSLNANDTTRQHHLCSYIHTPTQNYNNTTTVINDAKNMLMMIKKACGLV